MLLEEELSAELSDEDATNLIQLHFTSTRKAVLEKIVLASDNKKKYYTKAQKISAILLLDIESFECLCCNIQDMFLISKRDITIPMRNYPQLPHKFMSDKRKIHHLLEIIVQTLSAILLKDKVRILHMLSF